MDFPMGFIKATEEYCTLKKHISAPLFRRSFVLEELPVLAKLVITGLGYYKVYINGKEITKGFFAPYRSNIDDMVYYDEYDLKGLLLKGKNTLGIVLGNGLKNALGAFTWDFDKARFRGAPETAFSIELDFGASKKELISSDENTLTAPSAIVFDDLHFGEYYDARLEIEDWNKPEFDDSNWKCAIRAEIPKGEARFCEAEPIIVKNEIKPIEIIEYENGYIYDFGVNTSGVCRLKIKGERGQRLVLRHFETLKEQKPYYKNFRFDINDRFQEDEYTLRGGGYEEYTPSFTYHGFRYVYVEGISEKQATFDLLTYLELCSDIKKIGEFNCSDEVVNKIQEATLRSDYSNFYYFPTDCPQREKNGWTADASLSAEQMLMNMAPEKSYKEWLRNIYKALSDEGQLPGIVPTTGWGYTWGNGPAWDNVIINLPYYTYIYRGDKEILEELAAPLMRYLNYLYSKLKDTGLMEIGLGDWCEVGGDEWEFSTPLVVTDTILTHDIAKKAAFVYNVLGMKEQEEFANKLACKTRKAFRENLIGSDLTVIGETQTAQAMAIFYGMFEESEKQEALKILLGYIEDKDGHFFTGVLGGRIIYRLLADNGYSELAYNMIVRPDFPSYGNWISRGATTLWENFLREDEKIISLNHHFWGDVSAWFYTYLAGIRINPTLRDINNIDIKPCFIERLNRVSAHHETPNGGIKVEWFRKGDAVILDLSVTDSMYGKICAPCGYDFDDGSIEKSLKTGVYKLRKTV